MKKCPFCGADIEDSARFCLYCMQPLVEKEHILLHQKKKPQWLLIIAAIVAIFLILVMIWCSRQLMLESGVSSQDPSLNTSSPSQSEPSDPPVTEPPHVHSYSVENTAIEYQKEAATCTSPALFYYSCACGEKGSNTFPHGEVAEHAIVTDPGNPADCVNTGLTEGSHCSVCNTVFLLQTQLPVTPHTFDNDRDESCNVCNYVRVIDCAHTETIQLAAVAPTCTTGGLTAGKKCALCEEILVAQSTIDPLGHTEVIDQAVAPTCSTDGKTEGKHCATCNTVLVAQATVAAKGHTEVVYAPAVAATCTTPGQTEEKHCTVCKAVTQAQTTVKAFGHTEVIDAAIPVTCTTNGITEGSHCSVCQTVFREQELLFATGHTFAVGDYPSVCVDCDVAGTVTINAPQFPLFLNDTYRIDSCTYKISPASGSNRYWIDFTFMGVNLSSETIIFEPNISLRGVNNTETLFSTMTMTCGSNSPGTYWGSIRIEDPNGTYELVFE